MLRGHDKGVWCAAWSPDGSTIGSVGTGESRLLVPGTERVHAVVYRSDGAVLAATTADDRVIRFYDAHTGEPITG